MRQRHTGNQAGPPPLYSPICAHRAGTKPQGLNEGTADSSGHSVIQPSDTHFHFKLPTNMKESSRSLGQQLCRTYPK